MELKHCLIAGDPTGFQTVGGGFPNVSMTPKIDDYEGDNSRQQRQQQPLRLVLIEKGNMLDALIEK